MTFIVTYRDGTVVEGLDFQESMELFLEAHGTDNPAVLSMTDTSYHAP